MAARKTHTASEALASRQTTARFPRARRRRPSRATNKNVPAASHAQSPRRYPSGRSKGILPELYRARGNRETAAMHWQIATKKTAAGKILLPGREELRLIRWRIRPLRQI